MMKFSITIPAFKTKFLAECIESCIAQTYINFEIIIVDDASPEDIKSIVEKYSDSRIRYFRNEKNCGAINVVDNWNICLQYCTGDYVICMGDDDKLLPCCLEEYAKLISKSPGIGALHAWTEIIDEKSQPVKITAPRPLSESALSVAWNRLDNRKYQFIGDWCFEIAWLRENGGFYKLPLAWGSDDISAIIGASKNGVLNTQIPCFQYRINSQTISSTGNINVKMAAIKKEQDWYREFLLKTAYSETDELYRIMMQSELQLIFDKKYGRTISHDLNKNIFHILKWIKLKKHYGYSNSAIGYAIYLWLKH